MQLRGVEIQQVAVNKKPMCIRNRSVFPQNVLILQDTSLDLKAKYFLFQSMSFLTLCTLLH